MDHPHSTILQKSVQKITPRPGVYLYHDTAGNIIYVGKAKNLRNRIRQYFTQHRKDAGPKTNLLVSQIASIKTIPTDSEFDALLLEATLIKKYQPKYNAIAKDDKSPLYIAITLDEPLPRILFTRKTTIDSWQPIPKRRFIAGPFQSGRVAHRLMRSVRSIIPYCTQKRRDGRQCFYTHIGLCNPCPSLMSKMPQGDNRRYLTRIYRNNLGRIALLLSGQARRVRTQLEKTMREYAGRMAFEEAGEYKRQLEALNILLTHAWDPGVYTDRTSEPSEIYQTRLTELTQVLTNYGLAVSRLERIECVDISTIQGEWATGALVVFTGGFPDTDEYRRFRIKAKGKPNDVGMIAEVIKRRFTHPEWPSPNLLMVDGGKPQVNAAIQAMHAVQATRAKQEIPVVGLAKRFEEIVVPLAGNQRYAVIRLSPASPALQLLQHIRDEAHRFAKKYHTLLRTAFDRP